MTLQSNLKIFLYKIDINAYLIEEEKLISLLSQEEKEKSLAYATPQLRSRFNISHAILRKILSKHALIPPQKIKYNYNNYNKPYLCQPPQNPWYFSISHSQNITCYSVAQNHEIGIDIEHCILQPNLNALINAVTTSREQEYLDSLSNSKRMDAFYSLWSTKEAILKALGIGLSYPINKLEIDMTSTTKCILVAPYDGLLKQPSTIYHKPIADNKNFKIVVASPIQKMRIILCNDFKSGTDIF